MTIIYFVWCPTKPSVGKKFKKLKNAKQYVNKQKIECCINKVTYTKRTSDCDTIYSNGK
jgi:hypothetical protein